MTTATRQRGFPNYTMAGAASDKPQQPISSGGFRASNLYPSKNIWNSTVTNARDRPIGSKEPDERPSGSSALNANSEADVWGAGPWNKDRPPRSVSTSPNRTRDGAIPSGAGFYDQAAIGLKNGFGGSKGFHDDQNGYNTAFSHPRRSPQESNYLESITGRNSARDPSLPPSRHSQGSPGFSDFYPGHSSSHSMQSQRQLPGHAPSFSTQSTNQRAFNFNKHIDEDLSLKFGRRVNIDNGGVSFNPASTPFQLNPGSQPWVGEGNVPRFGDGFEFSHDMLASQFSTMKRPSIDRASPGPSYRLEPGASPRSYAPTPDPWSSRPPSRDPRSVDERRTPAQQYAPNFQAPLYPAHFQYANLPQYAPSFLDPYAQNFRHPAMPGYALPPMHGFQLASGNLPPMRPSRDQDPSKGVRSALLDEFRLGNKSSRRYELKDIYNYVVEFSGDQHGSRFIQQKLETANSDDKDQVFREIEPNAIQLMKDVFGNYVVQKFFEHGNQVQKKVLAEKMKGKVVDLSMQVYACRVVQKAMEHVLVEQQAELTQELEPDILKVIRDQNGNHVVQKIIELVPRQYLNFVMDALRGQVTGLASHTYGCRVIQRMLEHGTEADKADIMGELHSSAQILITDQYGNYVVQHVIQNGKPEDRQRIIQLVMAQLLTLSKHKFASNVVEKCIEFGSVEQRTSIRETLTATGSDGTSPLQQMMKDQYGNYVIQKLLAQLHGSERDMFVEEIKPQFFLLKKNGASRQVQALEKLLGLNGAATSVKSDGPAAQRDANSMVPTPVLTDETTSPKSSSPPSTNVSAVDMPAEDGVKSAMGIVTGVTPQVRDNEAEAKMAQ